MSAHPTPGRNAPLAGVRVLDLSRLLPGPMCTLHLADLGADVIKVEDTGEGDYARRLDAGKDAARGVMSSVYRLINRNKRSLALNLKAPGGSAAFLRVAARADVILESFRPGVLDRLGVGYAAVQAINPRVVYCAISGFGQTGPYRDRPGHDINYLGYAGVLDQTGAAGGPPVLSNVQIADLLGGAMNAATAILAALFDAQRTGLGRCIDIAMTEGSLINNIYALHALETHGATPARGAALLTGGMPGYGVYATRDGRYLAVGALEQKFWGALCDALERPDLANGRFAQGSEGDTVRRELAAVLATRTQAEWIQHLAGVDCCVTPVLTLDEALEDPQVTARQMVVTAPDGSRQYSTPLHMTGHDFAIARAAPTQGEQSAEVLREAGFSADEIATLATAGTISGSDVPR